MAGQAKITSVEALESFRAKLIIFLAQARSVLEEVSNEMSRTRQWLQNDQRTHWEHELRRRERRLEEARQELFNSTLSAIQAGTTALLQLAVQRAQRAVLETETKLGSLKRWDHELDDRAAPLMRQIEQLQGFLGTDMTRAVAFLDQALKALEAYQKVGLTAGSAAAPMGEEPK